MGTCPRMLSSALEILECPIKLTDYVHDILFDISLNTETTETFTRYMMCDVNGPNDTRKITQNCSK